MRSPLRFQVTTARPRPLLLLFQRRSVAAATVSEAEDVPLQQHRTQPSSLKQNNLETRPAMLDGNRRAPAAPCVGPGPAAASPPAPAVWVWRRLAHTAASTAACPLARCTGT